MQVRIAKPASRHELKIFLRTLKKRMAPIRIAGMARACGQLNPASRRIAGRGSLARVFLARRRKRQVGSSMPRDLWSRSDLFHRFDTAAANGRMLGVLANVRFPMPAALTFLAVGANNYFVCKVSLWITFV